MQYTLPVADAGRSVGSATAAHFALLAADDQRTLNALAEALDDERADECNGQLFEKFDQHGAVSWR
ncbi:MAG: hypothetical protein P4L40_08610 [Terracidiphilus sp.]|nr:hypothetical protein [Terracidiphilus sp.]